MPASITSIDRKMIEESGARSLFDLLEIYVPNFHYLPHHYEAPHMGVRGLISHRDDKYLLVVNGRVLNEKTHFGALSERDMPMLGDIRKIDVVRGPGSVVYGPGAVSMVINIQTDSFADHGSDGIYHTIYRKDQIQNSQSVRSGMNRYKKCIRQNINRYPDHTCNTLKNILKKLFQHKFVMSFP